MMDGKRMKGPPPLINKGNKTTSAVAPYISPTPTHTNKRRKTNEYIVAAAFTRTSNRFFHVIDRTRKIKGPRRKNTAENITEKPDAPSIVIQTHLSEERISKSVNAPAKHSTFSIFVSPEQQLSGEESTSDA